jgi:hypothetical protein
MDKHLEKLVSELAQAINDAAQNSEEVNAALERIQALGSEVRLSVVATIELQEAPPEMPLPVRDISIEERLQEISSEDRKFLRSLNIKFDQDE